MNLGMDKWSITFSSPQSNNCRRGGESDRLSIQLFSLSKPGHFIEAPKELVDEEHPLLFKPFKTLGLFGYAASEAPPSDLFKAYCGV
ncbi:hypothetical protein MTR67_008530 [Solanum verrucosum]|uniref:Uncharacterized protein n=1 Tax=Solanum verrucosum TaxID=315347 RepID=A0AAF0TJE5_SOLVR|nr:hypothetical protein MTR67_008530 [Solanum verrucosum]